jgi:hypothetical protein
MAIQARRKIVFRLSDRTCRWYRAPATSTVLISDVVDMHSSVPFCGYVCELNLEMFVLTGDCNDILGTVDYYSCEGKGNSALYEAFIAVLSMSLQKPAGRLLSLILTKVRSCLLFLWIAVCLGLTSVSVLCFLKRWVFASLLI